MLKRGRQLWHCLNYQFKKAKEVASKASESNQLSSAAPVRNPQSELPNGLDRSAALDLSPAKSQVLVATNLA